MAAGLLASRVAGGARALFPGGGPPGETVLEIGEQSPNMRVLSFMRRFLLLLCLLVPATGRLQGAEDLASRVVILANRDDPSSLRLAHYYAEKRSIPERNIVAFSMPSAETITWAQFVATIWQPAQDELIRLGWIDALAMGLKDTAGRGKIAPHGHRISYLVVCRGVPLRISHDAALYDRQRPSDLRAELHTNQAAVDSELALLAQSDPPVNGLVDNPLFQKEAPDLFVRGQVIPVSRLDGPTEASARALVDHALEGERGGLVGRAYVDIGGLAAEGDRRLERVAAQLTVLGFAPEIDREPTTFPAAARFDAPALYFGWYAANLNGPFALPGFVFPAGAVALHIHSYSARTLRSASDGWCGPLVARGVTATVGNVFEPYLEFTHAPDLLLHALAEGMTFGDAAAYALPALSWQAIAIGDPLYRPFAISVAAQLRRLDRLTPRAAGYVALRQAALLERQGRKADALALLQQAMAAYPGPALALGLAERLELRGDRADAVGALALAARGTMIAPGEWEVVRQVALRLQDLNEPRFALEAWQRLLAADTIPRALRLVWLEEAGRCAHAAGDDAQAASWHDESGGAGAPE